MPDLITFVGLFLNLVGTIMVAFAFGKNPGEAHQEDEKGRKLYLASFLRPNMFRVGLVVLGVGFAMQAFPAFCRIVSE